jgi:hypothetical protein
MRNISNWIQWTVIFLILGSAAWFAYPEIDPFELSGEVPPYMRLNQRSFTQNRIYGKQTH